MKLSRPLVVLDLETTGTWVEKDRIIEIALIKLMPDGTQLKFHKKVNPGIPIPEKITELTGISNEEIKDAPGFSDIAEEVLAFLEGVDFGGFNMERFDLPILERQLFESGGHVLEWRNRRLYDAQKIFHINEKRDLSAAYRFYCGQTLDKAHTALADAAATVEILEQQVSQYGQGATEIDVLDQFDYQRTEQYYDSEGKLCWWNGALYPTFGKYGRKQSLQELVEKDANYLRWVLKADFSAEVKKAVKAVLDGQVIKMK